MRAFLLGAAWLLAAGCTSNGQLPEHDQAGTAQPSFLQVKAEPDSYKGQPVVFGGEVLGARRLKDSTRIEILQLPLTSSLYPITDLTQSQGRFVAMHREFLDPATIPEGTFVTVTGEVAGAMTLPLDETDYTYPIIEIKNLRVWKKEDTAPMYIRPYIGPRPYGGPYWGPYWNPWPYW
mgnify:CR=1 FL=1